MGIKIIFPKNTNQHTLKSHGKRLHLNASHGFLLAFYPVIPRRPRRFALFPAGYPERLDAVRRIGRSQERPALVMISPAASLAAIRSIARRSYVFAMRRLTPTAFATSFHGRAHKYLQEMVAHNSA